jgi:Na+:H+ antiporter, NhaA family
VSKVKRIRNTLQEFSLPLIFGVVFGLIIANIDEHLYHDLVHFMPLGEGAELLGHKITLHFLINDIFMVLFFGIAAKEITESVLPGGALNPPSKAINPLLGTLGGVIGPVIFFFIFAAMFMSDGISDVGGAITAAITPGTVVDYNAPEVIFRGWGIPTATDIALAWLVAKIVFGNTHPAVNFLLLLAVADDAIGLGIIAVFYPDPNHPAAPEWLALVALGMLVSYGFRKMNVKKWTAYIFVGGFLSWLGLLEAHLHPALALVPIVPFLPGPERDLGLYVEAEEEEDDGHGHGGHTHSPLEEFEHQLKTFVDFGLFFFAFANAGVKLDSVGVITWVILAALIVGKTIGICFFSWGGSLLGFPLPEGMRFKHLIVAGVVAGLGLTVALFVTGEAYPEQGKAALLQGPAKMGAVFSAGAGLLAILLGRLLKVHQKHDT